jgi:CubicO group peptidase (beta-lactamase class C family)
VRHPKLLLCSSVIVLGFGFQTFAQTLPPDITEKIDKLAADTLSRTGVPSASVAVVKDGRIAYVKAYGDAKLEPKTPAKSEMRYSIGSISKQFTAAAILMLQEQRKLSLDDKVAKYFPDLTRAMKSRFGNCFRTRRVIRTTGRRIT